MQGQTFLWWPIIACKACGRGLFAKKGGGGLYPVFLPNREKRVEDLQDYRCGVCSGDEGESSPGLEGDHRGRREFGGSHGANRSPEYLFVNMY